MVSWAKLFRPKHFAELTPIGASRYRARASRPSAASSVASRLLLMPQPSPPLRGGDIYRETSAACDVHLQSRRPVLEFVRVIEILTAGGAGVGPGNGGNT